MIKPQIERQAHIQCFPSQLANYSPHTPFFQISLLQDTVRRECEERFELTEALCQAKEQLKIDKVWACFRDHIVLSLAILSRQENLLFRFLTQPTLCRPSKRLFRQLINLILNLSREATSAICLLRPCEAWAAWTAPYWPRVTTCPHYVPSPKYTRRKKCRITPVLQSKATQPHNLPRRLTWKTSRSGMTKSCDVVSAPVPTTENACLTVLR